MSSRSSAAALRTSRSIFDLDGKRALLDQLREQAADPELWNDPDRARTVTTQLSRVESDIETVETFESELDDLEVLDELAREQSDPASSAEVSTAIERLTRELDRLEIVTLLAGEHDEYDAIVLIHAGEGGVDAMDWTQMLQRMYLRWAETRGFSVEVIDEQFGEEAGLKSATLAVHGQHAYGLLKTEHGVHRLVRMSPFDSASRRQTSFALVDVVPELPEVDTEVDVPDEEIRVDVYRSSGPGGQSVNTTDSAVRITHLPTGIVVSCQNEKSQHQNKAVAMRVLKSKLADRARMEREQELDKLRGGKQNVGFGSQIRSYVLHPYQMVKDLRTGYETGNIEAVIDGDLDELIEAELRRQAAEAAAATTTG
jgi:peptide chain release factor 2